MLQSFPSPPQRASSVSLASCSLTVGWNPVPTRAGAARLCVRRPPACPVKPTVYSLPAGLRTNSGGGASCSITKTMVPYGGQKELRLAFSPHNNSLQHIMCDSGHLRVTVFCITSDKKGKVISSPFVAIIGRT